MKKMICEICGSSKFIKEDNQFKCQVCELQYTVEEAKKLLVDDGTEDTLAVARYNETMPVEIGNRVANAINEYHSGDLNRAYSMFLDVLNLDPMNDISIIYKAILYIDMGNIDDHQIQSCAKEVVRGLGIMKRRLKDDALFGTSCSIVLVEMHHLCTALLNLYIEDDIEMRNEFNARVSDILEEQKSISQQSKSQNKSLLYTGIGLRSSYLIGNAIGNSIADSIISKRKMNSLNQQANEASYNFHMECDNMLNERCVVICNALNYIASTALDLIEDKQNAEIDFYRLIIDYTKSYESFIIDNPMTTKYPFLLSDLNYIRNTAQEAIRYQVAIEMQEKKNKLIEEERNIKMKTQAYWKRHAEDKKQLEEERDYLEKKRQNLQLSIDEKERILDSFKAQIVKLPKEEKIQEKEIEIVNLEYKINQLGLFKKKEKEELEVKIEKAKSDLRIMQYDYKILKEKAKSNNEMVNKKIEEYVLQLNPLKNECNTISRRIKEINIELEKPRE